MGKLYDELTEELVQFIAAQQMFFIKLEVDRVADSCGWNIPLYQHVGARDYYDKFAEKLGPEGIRQGQLASNMHSIDGLPGLKAPSGWSQ